MRLTDAVPMAKGAVSALEAAGALGLQPNRYGRCACPIHGGRDRNLKLFPGEKGYYCFVCHAGGDVIDLVQQVNGTDLRGAVAWLDWAFHLGLNIDSPDDRDRHEAVQRAIQRRRERQREQERERTALHNTQLDALSLEMELDDLIDASRPRRYSEEWSDAFCTALKVREELREIEKDLAVMVSMSEERRHDNR